MLPPWRAYTVIVWGLLAVCAYGAGPQSTPPDPNDADPIDLVEESAVAGMIGPDVIVGDLHQVANYGSSGGPISAFAVGTVSCNIGDFWLNWDQNSNQHPVIGQSLYRLKNDRFEHIGQSWLKHGFYALSENLCYPPNTPSSCQPTDGTHLGVHCSDPYSAILNGTQTRLGPKYQVNAHTGVFTYPPANPTTPGNIARRLQVHNSDLDPSLDGGGLYFVEGHYVTPDDAAAGNQNNNASYRRVTVNLSGSTWTLLLPGTATTQREQPAIRAWKDTDPTVVETDAQVPGEGLFILSAKAINLGTGFFRYEYAVQNLNSDRSGASFTVPLPNGVSIANIGFHDVDYHDGDGVACPGCVCAGGVNSGLACTRNSDCPGSTCIGSHINFDGTDWPATVEVGKITWSTTPYDTDPNANALRWGTLYNFRFDANIGPYDTTVTLGLFKTGSPTDPSELSITTVGPALAPIDCNNNLIPDSCDVDCDAVGCTPQPPCPTRPFSWDCDGNGVPDECQDDCNDDGIPDFCEINPEQCEPDCNHDGVPDVVSEDCQPNGIPDECDILSELSIDCQPNGIPDECETIEDCDGDGIDDCDDLCPCTTPPNACTLPNNNVNCCFCNPGQSGICISYPRSSCLLVGGTPICSEPPHCSGTPCPNSLCREGCMLGDFDSDGDLDLFDVGALQFCFSASVGSPAYVAPSGECLIRFDFDNDGDVDDVDYFAFFESASAYPGP